MPIHPTCIIDPAAQIDPSTEIGPYCIIQGPVRIGPDNTLLAHCYINGHVQIGAGNRIGPYVCVGTDAQSIGHYPDDTGVVIGDRNVIREFAQVHRSITAGHPTRVGNGNLIMSTGHVAHDCVVGNDCVLSNGAHISGHCEIGDRAIVSSPTGVHQFVRIGRLAFISSGAQVGMDVPPFTVAEGRNAVRALNVVGMRRAGIGAEARAEVKRVYKQIYLSDMTVKRAVDRVNGETLCPEAREFVEFCRVKSRRGILPHARQRGAAEDESGE
jgi:UDP-N-acetylglucosamine acyltransferase